MSYINNSNSFLSVLFSMIQANLSKFSMSTLLSIARIKAYISKESTFLDNIDSKSLILTFLCKAFATLYLFAFVSIASYTSYKLAFYSTN